MTREDLTTELNNLWKERQEVINPKEELDDEDSFKPAETTKMNKDEALVYMEL